MIEVALTYVHDTLIATEGPEDILERLEESLLSGELSETEVCEIIIDMFGKEKKP